ncbi:glutaminyl-peptide cyclotransferase [Deinococcus sonorensis]|uniref:Glutaminyl-peptide cyclotransferase n=2 Tax=Deinococcus sonorensis TaxID=309891 RepID=A0AAU7UBD0_9DEIO
MTSRLLFALTLTLVGLTQASSSRTGPLQARATPSAPAARQATPVFRPTVIARTPHDPAAFTEGFELSGDVLYESTGLEQQSEVRRTSLSTGRVLQRRSPPVSSVFGEGLTVLGGQLYQLTWKDGLAFVYDAASLRETGRFKYDGEGWGLTNDGQTLIMSNGSSALTFRDPRTFEVRRSLNVTDNGMPVTRLNELEYAGGSIWANVWLTNRIARIDPKSGRVTAWLDVSELSREAVSVSAKAGRTLSFDDVPNGIAYNRAAGTLLLTGKRWPTVFEVRVPDLGPATP